MLLGTPLMWALVLTCAFFLFTGVASLWRPRSFASALGLSIVGDSGINEVRAQYGGFFLVAAVANAMALAQIIPATSGVLMDLVIFGGLFLGRVLSLAGGGDFSTYVPTVKVLHLVDGVGFATFAALANSS